MKTGIDGIGERHLRGVSDDSRAILADCVQLVGPDLVRFLLPRLINPKEFLESIVETESLDELLKGVVNSGQVDPRWRRLLHAVPPELALSVMLGSKPKCTT